MSAKRAVPRQATVMIDTSAWPCLRISGDQTIVDVSVSPNAKKTELVGWHDGALRIRLQAPPVEGAANEALRKWLAQSLDLPGSSVKLLRGDTSRRKQLSLDCSADQVITWLAAQPTLRNTAAGS
jgi:uncharacterized protein (TIGR00251 family)